MGKGKCKKIFAFEPDINNCQVCKKNFEESCPVEYHLETAGLWSEKTVLKFVEEDCGSHINEKGTVEVPTVNIDEVVGDSKVTFIKMDIEGAELEALKGASKTIQVNKPRLAICLYHKAEDIIEIPKYIKELVPEYKLFIRHYYPYFFDTVLYAVIEE